VVSISTVSLSSLTELSKQVVLRANPRIRVNVIFFGLYTLIIIMDFVLVLQYFIVIKVLVFYSLFWLKIQEKEKNVVIIL